MNYVLVYYIISDSYRYDPCMRCVAGDFLLLIQGHDCWWWLCFLAPSSGSRLNLDDYWIMLPAIDYQISTIFILSGHWRGFFLWNLWGSSRILEVITDAPDVAWDSRILFFWRRILSLFQESLSLSLSLGRESQRCPSKPWNPGGGIRQHVCRMSRKMAAGNAAHLPMPIGLAQRCRSTQSPGNYGSDLNNLRNFSLPHSSCG